MLLANRGVCLIAKAFTGRRGQSEFCSRSGLAEREFLARIGRQGEPEYGHAGDQDARHDQVEEVVERASSDDDDEGDVYVRFRAAIVVDLVSLTRHTCKRDGSVIIL